jgi:hypothetical protein
MAGVAALFASARAEDLSSRRPATDAAVDTSRLREIEHRVLPPVLVPGPAQYDTLPAYYWAANRELRERLENARSVYEAESSRPYRALTLVAGAAGVGKSFFKDVVFRKDYPADAVCKFDIKELYSDWQAEGKTFDKPDLHDGPVVLSRLLSQSQPQRQDLLRFLESKPAAFFVIDSLDEIHPDDYVAVLEQIEQFALRGDRDFVHVVVFGRSLAFGDYWRGRSSPASVESPALFVLNPPVFRTTGDLLVSSWNYHTWKYKLKWAPDGGELALLPLAAYAEWSEQGFPRSGPFASLTDPPNDSLTPRVRDTVSAWAQSQRLVGSALYNLAGNSLVREFAEQSVREGRPFDEPSFMAAYLQKWLERETASENRPSARQPEYLDLYLRLLQGAAVQVLAEGRVDDNGCFAVAESDVLEIDDGGRRLVFPVKKVLDHSGLKHFDPRQAAAPRYHFEPIWMHRLLVEMHNERIRWADGLATAATER